MVHPRLVAIARWLANLVASSKRRAWTTLGLALVVVVAAGLYARGIRVNTNLEALLADDSPSVRALGELRERQGPTDLLNIAVRSTDPEANRRLVEDVLAAVQTWPEVRDAYIDLDYTPLRDHALYYLEVDELEDLRDRLRAERKRAVANSMGLTGVDIDPDQVLASDDWDEELEEDFDSPEDTDAPTPSEGDESPSAESDSLATLLDDQRARIVETGRIRPSDLDLIWPKENERGEIVWEDEVRKPVASPDGEVMLVRARLLEPPTNLDFSTRVTGKVDALLEELDVTTYAPDMLAKVGGAYGSSQEATSIIADLAAATWLSGGMVVVVLVVGFRSARSLVIVLAPLTTSVIVTVALARLVLGELNVLTAFLFAVLLGIGVDFAVHLYAQRERQGLDGDWAEVLTHHLRPLFASMLTTVGSFLVLTLADFRGFQEFGLIAAVGVVVAFVAALVMVPPLYVLVGGKGSPSPLEAQTDAARAKYRAPLVRVVLLLTVGVVGALGAPKVRFEKDMRNLRSPKSKSEKGIGYQRALKGTQETGTPVVLLADSSEQLEAAVDVLEAQREIDVLPGTDRGWIRSLYSLGAYLPEQQQSKVSLLAEIAAAAEELKTGDKDQEHLSHLEALERLAGAKPITEQEIPSWAKQLFVERDGQAGQIGLVYTQVQGYDLEQVVYVTNRFAELMEPLDVRGASTRFILGDLTIEVEQDTQRLPPYALAVIGLLIFVDLRRLGPSLLTFGTLCYGLLLTFGVMGLWPIRINFYNLVVMPAVVGLGIDESIHLWHARKTGTVGATTKAALITSLTTAGGFSGLVIAEHGGLKSIGLLGVTATLCCVLVAIVILGWPRRRT